MGKIILWKGWLVTLTFNHHCTSHCFSHCASAAMSRCAETRSRKRARGDTLVTAPPARPRDAGNGNADLPVAITPANLENNSVSSIGIVLTCADAARSGKLEVLKYARENGCPGTRIRAMRRRRAGTLTC